jgi:hypothetical protein
MLSSPLEPVLILHTVEFERDSAVVSLLLRRLCCRLTLHLLGLLLQIRNNSMRLEFPSPGLSWPITVSAWSETWTSSPDPTLRSWVRIPLEAWMCVWVYFLFVSSCVGSDLAAGWSPVGPRTKKENGWGLQSLIKKGLSLPLLMCGAPAASWMQSVWGVSSTPP